MAVWNRSKILADPRTDAGQRQNWNAFHKYFGKVRTNENHQEPQDLIDVLPHTATIDPILGGTDDNQVDFAINGNPRVPGADEDDTILIWDNANSRFNYGDPIAHFGTNLRLPVDVRIAQVGGTYKLQVQEKTFKIPNTEVTDHGWVDKYSFKNMGNAVTNVFWNSITKKLGETRQPNVWVVASDTVVGSDILTAQPLATVVTSADYDVTTGDTFTNHYTQNVYVFEKGSTGSTSVFVTEDCESA